MLRNPFDLSGKAAIVTGGGQGLGREFALALAGAGADVLVAEINPDSGPRTAEACRHLGVRSQSIVTDVTDPASVEAMTAEADDRFGRLDVLVNNAGMTAWGPAESVVEADWQQVLDLNLAGLYRCCRSAGAVMLQAGGGSIVNIASMSGLIVNVPQKQWAYNASKAAVIHLTRTLAVEWARGGVRVNAISPGYMDTPMARPFFEDPDVGGVWMDRIPMGRPGRPEELGPLCVYLASEGSSYVTGSNIVIDGGYTCT